MSPDELDTKRRHRAANLSRRAKLLRFHARMRGADGKSISAVRGGHARMGRDPALARAAATEMAIKRWYKDEEARAVPAPHFLHLSRGGSLMV